MAKWLTHIYIYRIYSRCTWATAYANIFGWKTDDDGMEIMDWLCVCDGACACEWGENSNPVAMCSCSTLWRRWNFLRVLMKMENRRVILHAISCTRPVHVLDVLDVSVCRCVCEWHDHGEMLIVVQMVGKHAVAMAHARISCEKQSD